MKVPATYKTAAPAVIVLAPAPLARKIPVEVTVSILLVKFKVEATEVAKSNVPAMFPSLPVPVNAKPRPKPPVVCNNEPA